ncbi:retrovirus-related pol polyprotein from transposon TNT 1-94 [Tanacetum coccineum]
MTSSTPICFMAKASPTQAWLWHQRLSHLNFDYINRNKNVDNSSRYKNDNLTGQFRNQMTVTVAGSRETISSQETKRVKDNTYHKEKMLLCKQAEKGVSLQAMQADWLEDMDKRVDSNVIPNSPDMCNDDIKTDQNAKECDDERVALANLISNLKLDIDENKKIQKQLKKANASLTHELKECKSILAETSRTLKESNSTRDSCLIALQRLLSQKEIDIKEGLKLKAYEILVVKEKHDELVKQSFLTKSHYEGLVKDKTKIVQLYLFIVDSGFTKHMMSNLKPLCNFVEKYLGIVHFGNAQFASILGYGDLVQGNVYDQ